MQNLRIGHGYDAHRFGGEKPLMLGGVRVPHNQGLIAHSDGDVVLHAVCDSILGALALGDIGKHFPDTDNAFENVDSRELLKMVISKMREAGYCVNNLDVTIVAQSPRLSSYINSMRECIASDCAVPMDHIGVKATTTEKMGFVGREEGIEVHSVVLLSSSSIINKKE